MINQDFNTILDLIKTFPDEQSCINHFEEVRWGGNVVSPFDATSKVYKCKNNRYRCKNTGKYFNVKTATLFDNTKVPLQKWFIAIWLITGHKKGISSVQLATDLGVTQKTAWFMNHRIRECFGIKDEDQLNGEVEVDESYVGGRESNKHVSKRQKKVKGRGTASKKPVFGMLQRGGQVEAKVMDGIKAKNLLPVIHERVSQSALVITDEFAAYNQLGKTHDHAVVKHSSGQYVDGIAHTNSIEGFWSLLKRGIIGIYHYVSPYHLQKYVNEFSFRYNTRQLTTAKRINLLLANADTRTTYKGLING